MLVCSFMIVYIHGLNLNFKSTRYAHASFQHIVYGTFIPDYKRSNSCSLAHAIWFSLIHAVARFLDLNALKMQLITPSNIIYRSRCVFFSPEVFMKCIPEFRPNYLLKFILNKLGERNWVFATNSDFLIPTSLQSNVVDQTFQTMKSFTSNSPSLKYQRSTLYQYSKDIESLSLWQRLNFFAGNKSFVANIGWECVF